MSGWMMMVCWTAGMISVLAFLAIVTKMTLDYLDRRSQSRVKESQAMMQAMKEMVAQSAEVVRMQTELTEVLLVGRPRPAIEQQLEIESPQATLPTPDELWRDLPENIQEAYRRESEEASIWPNLYQKPPEESATIPDDLGEMENLLRESLSGPPSS